MSQSDSQNQKPIQNQNKKKKVKLIVLSLLILLPIVYTGGWFIMANIINQKIVQFFNGDGPAMGITFVGAPPVVKGFPGAPKLRYRKGWYNEKFGVAFKDIIVQGFPIPGFPISITINKGPNVYSWVSAKTYNLNDLEATFRMPLFFPRSTYRFHIQKWQQNVGTIKITSLHTSAKEVEILGDGYIGLDDNLQPLLILDGELVGYPTLIHYLVEERTISPLQGAVAQKAFEGLAKNPETDASPRIPIIYSVKDNQFRAGPLYLGPVPYINWRQPNVSSSSG